MYHHASHPMGISKVASFVVVPPPPGLQMGISDLPERLSLGKNMGTGMRFSGLGLVFTQIL